MKFRWAVPASASFSSMSNQPETKQRKYNKERNPATTINHLLTKSRSHELSSTLHTRHRKTSLIALIMKSSKLRTKVLTLQAFLEGSSQHVLQAFTLWRWISQYTSLSHSQVLHKIKGTSKPSSSSQQIHTCHTHTNYLTSSQVLTTLSTTTPKTKNSKLVAHSNGESLNMRSLHERWEDELISKEGSTNDGTSMPEKGGRHKQGQKPSLESSRRPTIGTNLPNLDHRGHITCLPRRCHYWII